MLRLAVAFERNRWWAEETAGKGGGIASQFRLATANQLYIYRARRAKSKVDLLTSVHQDLFLLVDLDRGMSNKRTEIGMSLSLYNLVPRYTYTEAKKFESAERKRVSLP